MMKSKQTYLYRATFFIMLASVFVFLSLKQVNPGVQPEKANAATVCPNVGGVHGYYETLRAMPQKVADFCLRDQAQLDTYMDNPSLFKDVTYTYPSDPDPRKQDGAKQLVPNNKVSLPNNVRFPIPSTTDGSLLITWDAWFGKEFTYSNTEIATYKNFQLASGRIWTEVRNRFLLGNNHRPPAIGMVDVRFYGQDCCWPGFMDTVQYNGIGYGGAVLGPMSGEFAIQPETWTRYWAYIKPTTQTWVYAGVTRHGYEFSLWVADVNQSPVKILDKIIISPNEPNYSYWNSFWFEYNTSSNKIPPGRGPLTSYNRNLVMLKNLDPETTSGILVRPTDTVLTITPPTGVSVSVSPSTISGGQSATLTAAATDGDGIAKVEFYHDSVLLGTDTSSPYSYTWTNVPPTYTPYQIAVRAYDNKGWSARSAAVALTVPASSDTTNPIIDRFYDGDDIDYIDRAASTGAKLSGKEYLNIEAHDDSGIASVQFQTCSGGVCKDKGQAITGPKSVYTVSWSTDRILNGNYTIKAIVMDLGGNISQVSVDVVVYNAGVAGVAETNLTSTGVTITWGTGTPMDSQVEYGPDSAYGSFAPAVPDPTMQTLHSQSLSGLNPSSNYHYRVRSRDAAGTLFTSPDFKFSTPGSSSSVAVTFTASPASITSGASSTLTWSSTGATSCAASGGWSGSKATSGSQTVSPTATSSYTLACTDGTNTTTRSATITVGSINNPPVGTFDGRKPDGVTLYGWSYDPDNTSANVQVHIYANGPAGAGGTLLGSTIANVPRPDINTGLLIPGDHGFEFTIPASLRDGASHSYYVYGIDLTSSAISTLLTGAPKSFTTSAGTPIVGDINLDHIVNSIDYSILNSKWFTSDAASDLNHDGIVNAIDFSILNSHWFETW